MGGRGDEKWCSACVLYCQLSKLNNAEGGARFCQGGARFCQGERDSVRGSEILSRGDETLHTL